MKKTSIVNLTVIIGLLVLCVMTLIAIYAATSESSTVLLFEENFHVLDDNKWEKQTSDCNEKGEQFHYSRTSGENSFVKDDVLYVHSIEDTKVQFRQRRGIPKNCVICLNGEKSDNDCILLISSTNFRTKDLFDAKYGRIELRAKLPTGDWIRTTIGIVPNNTLPQETEGFNLIETIGENIENGTADVRFRFGPGDNKTSIESSITTGDFHTYEIEWKDNKIAFKIDNQEVGKNITEFRANSTDGYNMTSFSQPFYLNVGVDVGKKNFTNEGLIVEHKRSLIDSSNHEKTKLDNENTLMVDYIRLYRISD